jgi:hypothetical protein
MLIKPPKSKSHGRSSSNITKMTIAFAALATSRRYAVRAFSSRALPTPFSTHSSAAASGIASTNGKVALFSQRPRTNRFSTAADSTDRELESALDELLGDVMEEAKNPVREGKMAKGHVEGSREFPRELLEVVSFVLFWGFCFGLFYLLLCCIFAWYGCFKAWV